jgi:hypothetical protein
MKRVFEDDPRVPQEEELDEDDPLYDPVKYWCPECHAEFDYEDEWLDHADTCGYLPWGGE